MPGPSLFGVLSSLCLRSRLQPATALPGWVRSLTCETQTIASFPIMGLFLFFLAASISPNKDISSAGQSSQGPDFDKQFFAFLPITQNSTKVRDHKEPPTPLGSGGGK